jgi:hypothetical protein
MPDAERTRRKPTFNTLAREEAFRNPPKNGSTHNILNEFVAPHIESFNALFDDSGLPSGDGDGRGLISLGLQDIGERVVFDGDGKVDNRGWGNRMRSEFGTIHCMSRVNSIQYGSSPRQLRVQWCQIKTNTLPIGKCFHPKYELIK